MKNMKKEIGFGLIAIIIIIAAAIVGGIIFVLNRKNPTTNVPSQNRQASSEVENQSPTSTQETASDDEDIPSEGTPTQSDSSPQSPAPAPQPSPTPSPTPTPPPTQPTPTPQPTSPTPAPQPQPPPAEEPPPPPAMHEFRILADDIGFYLGGQDISSVSVNSGEAVKITYEVKTTNVYYNGLRFSGCGQEAASVPPGGSTIFEFTAQSNCTVSSYWPSSGVFKDSMQVIVN